MTTDNSTLTEFKVCPYRFTDQPERMRAFLEDAASDRWSAGAGSP